MLDDLVGKWAQERLLHGPLAIDDATATQVWEAVTELRKDFSPKNATDAATSVDKWSEAKFMNAPPLTHNTQAVNQLKAAIANLKERLAEELKGAKAPAPQLPPLKSSTEPKE